MNRDNELDDLYYELAILDPSERIGWLRRLAETHPHHILELTGFYVELVFDELTNRHLV